jgi:hypothetical protein
MMIAISHHTNYTANRKGWRNGHELLGGGLYHLVPLGLLFRTKIEERGSAL